MYSPAFTVSVFEPAAPAMGALTVPMPTAATQTATTTETRAMVWQYEGGQLKAVRLRLARERQVPAYVIFSDRTLIDMTALQPRDLAEFAQVNGVGAAKLKDFGVVFLKAIAEHGGSA